jgi:L-asparaginase
MNTRVAVVATGGTIQNTPDQRVEIERVWARVAEYPAVTLPDIELEVNDILRLGSEAFGPDEWRQIATAVQEAVDRDDIDAVVVSHGTFTAEETAYLLHLVVDTTKPVAVVVSQRKHSTVGNDGDKNLVDAMRVVCSPQARELGVLLVVNDEIHCGREVTKEHQRPDGFQSYPVGPLGTVETDAVSFYRAPLRLHTSRSLMRRVTMDALPRVDIVAGFAGADATAISAACAAGADAIVLNGFAYSGRGTDAQIQALSEARDAGIEVVLTSRGRGGRIPDPSIGGFVRGDNLTAQKARVLAMLALAGGRQASLQDLYDTH